MQTPPPQLNLPAAPLSLRSGSAGVEVHDPLRRKWVALTSEEWVRQHFVHYLISVLGFPASLMGNEVGIRLNSTLRRCDTVVYSSSLEPLMIVEYKAPAVAIDQKVFDQIMRYNVVLRVPYLVISNGMRHYCIKFDSESGKYKLLTRFPRYEEL